MNTEDVSTIRIGETLFVYIDEEHVASVQELIDFMHHHETAFYKFRREWSRVPTRTMQ